MTEMVLPDADSQRIDDEFGAFLDEHPELQEQQERTDPYGVLPQLADTAFQLLARDATIMSGEDKDETPPPPPPTPPYTMLESTPQPGGAQPITDNNER